MINGVNAINHDTVEVLVGRLSPKRIRMEVEWKKID